MSISPCGRALEAKTLSSTLCSAFIRAVSTMPGSSRAAIAFFCSVRPVGSAWTSRSAHSHSKRAWSAVRQDSHSAPASKSGPARRRDRKSTRLNSSHLGTSYAVFCLKIKKAECFYFLEECYTKYGSRVPRDVAPRAIHKVVYEDFLFFNDTATTEIYTLSLHDALPIWCRFAPTAATMAVETRPISRPA